MRNLSFWKEQPKRETANSGQAPEFCTNTADLATNFPLKVKAGMAEKLLGLQRYKGLDTNYLRQQAKNRLGDKSPIIESGNVPDRATAIAVLMGEK